MQQAKDFQANAKEAFLDLDFDTFKIALAAESSLLATSSEDVNVMDDTNNEVNLGWPKVWRQCLQWFIQVNLLFPYKIYFSLVGNARCFGLLLFLFQIYLSTILSSIFMDEFYA